ncbi:MAG: orotidine-5'-phosphate decarboxylase [Candidatus Omnitrophica bacterium]|nr:orotidine-5'-phosphate decarboxylase [Candidatus Omnitrophota bacterium]
MKKNKTQLIVSLDTDSLEKAQELVNFLSKDVKFFKIGSQLFTAYGPKAVEMVHKAGSEVFLDLKFHDIPNTVAQSALSAMRLGVFMFNVHSCGGREMLEKVSQAVRDQAQKIKVRKPILLGVTVLTSIDRQALNALGVMRSVKNQVGFLARLSKNCGLDGVVCSGSEIALLRGLIKEDFILVVPGIRMPDSETDDQKRIITSADAAKLGADYIVVGRPVIKAKDPLSAAKEILNQLE